MSVKADFRGIEPVEILRPAQQRVPYVFSSPHSGRHYPARFLAQSRLDRDTIRRSEDFDIDRVFSCALTLGAPMVRANFPRAYLDVNREPMELDPQMFIGKLPDAANVLSARVAGGLGTIPRVVGEGLDIYHGALDVEEALDRIASLYEPYHAALQQLLQETQQRFGYAVLVDCHSMPGGVRAGGSKMRPDIIVGDRFGTSADHGLTRHAIGCLKMLGFRVAYNKPYAGGYITGCYGQPVYGVHAVQIEISRRLYMNERTMQANASYPALRDLMRRFCNDLTSYPDSGLYPVPMAAE